MHALEIILISSNTHSWSVRAGYYKMWQKLSQTSKESKQDMNTIARQVRISKAYPLAIQIWENFLF